MPAYPGQSCYRLHVPRPPKPTTEAPAWRNLAAAIPETEEDWYTARQRIGFHSTSTERISDLLLYTSKPSRRGRNFRILVFFAICRVKLYYAKDKSPIFSELARYLENPDLGEVMMNRYLRSVKSLIKTLDELFGKGLLHRAYELFLYSM